MVREHSAKVSGLIASMGSSPIFSAQFIEIIMNKQQKYLLEAYEKGYRVISGIAFRKDGYQMSSIKDGRGYLFFKPNKYTPVYLHRLVAYQKYGEKIFEDGIQVRHKNNIKTDNIDSNILIGNQSQNMLDIPKKQRRINASHKKYPHEEIIEYYSQVKSYKKTMDKFSISSKGTLHYILNKSMETEK